MGWGWGGQFERMVGLMTQCLYKTVGKANLSWQRLEEVLLDIEITLNYQPLNYLEDEIQFPVLNPNTLGFREETFNLEGDLNMTEGDLRKRGKCKDNACNRSKGKYLKSSRERHHKM